MRVSVTTITGMVITGEYLGTCVEKRINKFGQMEKVVCKNVGGQKIDTRVVDVIEYDYEDEAFLPRMS